MMKKTAFAGKEKTQPHYAEPPDGSHKVLKHYPDFRRATSRLTVILPAAEFPAFCRWISPEAANGISWR